MDNDVKKIETFSPAESIELGAFTEDAISEEEALQSLFSNISDGEL